jgi:hypothetical protein
MTASRLTLRSRAALSSSFSMPAVTSNVNPLNRQDYAALTLEETRNVFSRSASFAIASVETGLADL